MNNKLYKILLIILFILIINPIISDELAFAADTEIKTSVEWTGTIDVDGNIIIKNGSTLTITTGTTIRVDSGFEIIVENGNINATGATFTRLKIDGYWDGIKVDPTTTTSAISLEFDNCVFEYVKDGIDKGVILVNENNSVVSGPKNVSLTVTNSIFRNPYIDNGVRTNAIYYANGTNKAGSGSLTVRNSILDGYLIGVYIGINGKDDIDTIVEGCSFTNMTAHAINITDGRNVTISNNTFSNNINTHSPVVLGYTYNWGTNYPKNVVINGNIFNGNESTAAYPIMLHSDTNVNKDIESTNTMNNYPASYQYISVNGGFVGTTSVNNHVTWGPLGIPYLIEGETDLKINKISSTSSSSLTIKHGSEINFVNKKIQVDGSLIAKGTADKKITFRNKIGITLSGAQISSNGDFIGKIDLDYVVIDGLYNAIYLETYNNLNSSAVNISNTTFQSTGNLGIYIRNKDAANTILIENSTFNGSGSTCSAIQIDEPKNITIRNSTIQNYPVNGLVVSRNYYQTEALGAPIIDNCTIKDNGFAGILVARETNYNKDAITYSAIIKNSIITGNKLNIANHTNLYYDKYRGSIFGNTITNSTIGTDNVTYTTGTNVYNGSATTIIANETYTESGVTYAKVNVVDTTEPAFSTNYPKVGISQVQGSKKVGLLVKTSEGGTVYYVIVANSAAAPNASQVMAGLDSTSASAIASSNSAITANTEKSFVTAELPADDTDYDVYFVANDASNNSSTPTKLDIRTPLAQASNNNNDSNNNNNNNNNNDSYSDETYTPIVEAKPTVETKGNDSNTIHENKVSVSSIGLASVNIDNTTAEKLINSAKDSEKEGKNSIITFKFTTESDPQKVSLEIPRTSLSKLAEETNASFVIESKIARISLGNSVIDKISKSSDNGNVSFIVNKIEPNNLPESIKSSFVDRPVYSFDIEVGNTKVSDFGGSYVSVSIPYNLKSNENKNVIVVYYLDELGEIKTIRGAYKESTGTVDFVTNHFSNFAIGYNMVSFEDVLSESWYNDAVLFIAARGIIIGTTSTTFSPEVSLTREQFIVMLMRAYNIKPQINLTDNFVDVGNDYSTAFIAEAKRLGIATGVGENKFNPRGEIRREDMFTLIYRTLKLINQLPNTSSNKSLEHFDDASLISSYAKLPIEILVNADIISGNGSMIKPISLSTRAEMTQILYNLLK